MRRTALLSGVLAALLLMLASPGTTSNGPRRHAGGAEIDRRVRFIFTQAGLPLSHVRDLHNSLTVGKGEVVFPTGTVGSVAAGSIVHEDNYVVLDDAHIRLSLSSGTYREHRKSRNLDLSAFVTKSDDKSCPALTGAGRVRTAEVILQDGGGAFPDIVLFKIEGCARQQHDYVGRGVNVVIHPVERCTAAVSSLPSCGLPNPSQLTLTVNGTSATANAARPSAHPATPLSLASETPLTVRVTTNQPMPKGWKVVLLHPGDVLSQGNGVYYKVCELNDTTKAISCGDTRPGRIGPFDDNVYAQLLSPTRLVFNVQIDVTFRKP